MRLRIVPARTGMQWVREGMRAFARAPLAFTGLLFMVLAASFLLSIIPILGDALALGIMPAATVGLMYATQLALQGRFPMPTALVTAFQQSPRQTRAMLVLGAVYAASVLLIFTLAAWMDDGQLTALLAKHGNRISPELMADPAFQAAARSSMQRLMLGCLLYVPVSVLMWHAPALVHWHDMSVGKSLFVSAVAVLRNAPAFLMYGLGWTLLSTLAWLSLLLVAGLLGNMGLALNGMLPLSVLVMAVFYASLWFTFRDSFESEDAPDVDLPTADA